MPNIRMLTSQREMNEKQRLISQGVLKARRNQEQDTQDVAKKTDKSETARAAKKVSKDAFLAEAEQKLAQSKEQTAKIGAIIGGVAALTTIVLGVVAAISGGSDQQKADRSQDKADDKQTDANEKKEKVKEADKDVKKAEDDVNAAKNKVNQNPNDPKAQKELRKAEKKLDKAEEKLEDKKNDATEAQTEATQAQGEADTAQDTANATADGKVKGLNDKINDPKTSSKERDNLIKERDEVKSTNDASKTRHADRKAANEKSAANDGATPAPPEKTLAGSKSDLALLEKSKVAGSAENQALPDGDPKKVTLTKDEEKKVDKLKDGGSLDEAITAGKSDVAGQEKTIAQGEDKALLEKAQVAGKNGNPALNDEEQEKVKKLTNDHGGSVDEALKAKNQEISGPDPTTEDPVAAAAAQKDDKAILEKAQVAGSAENQALPDGDPKKVTLTKDEEKKVDKLTESHGGSVDKALDAKNQEISGTAPEKSKSFGEKIKEKFEAHVDSVNGTKGGKVTNTMSDDEKQAKVNETKAIYDLLKSVTALLGGPKDVAARDYTIVKDKRSEVDDKKGKVDSATKDATEGPDVIKKAKDASSPENIAKADGDKTKVTLTDDDKEKLKNIKGSDGKSLGIVDSNGNINEEALGKATGQVKGTEENIENIEKFKKDQQSGEFSTGTATGHSGSVDIGISLNVKGQGNKDPFASGAAVEKYAKNIEKTQGKEAADAFRNSMKASNGGFDGAIATEKAKLVEQKGQHTLTADDVTSAKGDVELLHKAQEHPELLTGDEKDKVAKLKDGGSIDKAIEKAEGRFKTVEGKVNALETAKKDYSPLSPEVIGLIKSGALDYDEKTGKVGAARDALFGKSILERKVENMVKNGDTAGAAKILAAIEKTPGMEGMAGKILNNIATSDDKGLGTAGAASVLGAQIGGNKIIKDGGASIIENAVKAGTIDDGEAATLATGLEGAGAGLNTESNIRKNGGKSADNESILTANKADYDLAVSKGIIKGDGSLDKEKLDALRKSDPAMAARFESEGVRKTRQLVAASGGDFSQAMYKAKNGDGAAYHLDAGAQDNGKTFGKKLLDGAGNGISSAFNGIKTSLGGAWDNAGDSMRRGGFLNSSILLMNLSMPAIQFMLQQLDKMREAQEQGNEAKKKAEAANAALKDLLQGMRLLGGATDGGGKGGEGTQEGKAGF